MYIIKYKTHETGFILFKRLQKGDYIYDIKGYDEEIGDITEFNISNKLKAENYSKIIRGGMFKTVTSAEYEGNIENINIFYNALKEQKVDILENLRIMNEFYEFRVVAEIGDRRLPNQFSKKLNLVSNLNVVTSISTFPTFRELAEKYDLSFLEEKNYRIIRRYDEFKELKSKVKVCKIPVLDSETTGLNMYNNSRHDEVIGYVISTEEDESYYIPVRHKKIENAYPGVLADLKEMIESRQDWGGFNCMFDQRALMTDNIDIRFKYDAQIMLRRLKYAEVKEEQSLKYFTHKIFKAMTLELKQVTGRNMAHLFTYCEEEVVRAYACPDADYTLKLINYASTFYESSDWKCLERDMTMIYEFSIDEYNGIPVNEKALDEEIEKEKHEITILEKSIYTHVGRIWMYNQMKKKGKTEEEIKTSKEFIEANVSFDANSQNDLKQVVFGVLRYPTTTLTASGQWKLGKDEFKKWLEDKLDISSGLFEGDIIDEKFRDDKDKPTVILKASDLNYYKYPFAALLKEYRDKLKNVTSFLGPMRESIVDGRIFTSYSFTKADTTRLIDKVQTLKKGLKRMVCGTDKEYMVVFDCAQEEIRVMCEMSNFTQKILKLNNPEKDSHKEDGAIFNNKPPHLITKQERSDIKGVAFGKPYGMGVKSLTRNIRKPPYTQAVEDEVAVIDYKWNTTNADIVRYLEEMRTMAIEKGYIINRWGRKIRFDISNMDDKKRGRIRRQAGNYPIQSYAADLLKIIYNKMTIEMKKRGLYGKIRRPLNIHDEFVIWVKNDVHIYEVYDLIFSCAFFVGLNGMKYYWGLSTVDDWLQGKKDEYEAPVNFVIEKVREYRKNPDAYSKGFGHSPKEFIDKEIEKYMHKRYHEALDKYDGDIVDIDKILMEWDNYYERGRIALHEKSYRKAKEKEGEDIEVPCLEKFFLEDRDEKTFKYKGGIYTLVRNGDEEIHHIELKQKEEDSEFKDRLNFQEQLDLEDDDGDELVIDNTKEDIFDRIKYRGISNVRKGVNDIEIVEKNGSFTIPVDKLTEEELSSIKRKLRNHTGGRQLVYVYKGKAFEENFRISTIVLAELNECLKNDKKFILSRVL